MTRLRRLLLLALVLGLTALVVPPSTVHEPDLSLVEVRGADAVDHPRTVVWILALGSDARPGQRVTRQRADAIQLVGLNLRTGAGTIIGIPRDSYVSVPGRGRDKINAALTSGGPRAMAGAVSRLVGIKPDYVVTAGFTGFVRMANAMGGVKVRSDFRFSDPVRPKGYRKGPNDLNGLQALIFARIRKSFPRGDFDRSANQQDLLRGILATARERRDRPGFMERGVLAVAANLDTDLTPAELFRLAQAVTEVKPWKVKGCVVGGATGNAGGASVVFPNVGQARRIARDVRKDATLNRGC